MVGVSGAGKTTLCGELTGFPEVAVLGDELMILRKIRHGLWAQATPFWGEFGAPGSNRRAALGRILFLEKGPLGLIPISPAEAQSRLLRNLVFFEESRDLLERAWDMILMAVRRHPPAILSWTRGENPGGLLDLLWP